MESRTLRLLSEVCTVKFREAELAEKSPTARKGLGTQLWACLVKSCVHRFPVFAWRRGCGKATGIMRAMSRLW